MSNIDRRDFLKGAAATVALFLTTEQLMAAEGAAPAAANIPGPPVKFGVVGMGQWGKDVLAVLAKMPCASVTAICDTYEPYIKKGQEIAADAATFTDYRKLLESPEVEAVIVATPPHLHKDIALAAIQAGKHVYCEAPLATTVEDAKAIALAGLGSTQVFQVGLQGRSNLLYKHVSTFVKTGVLDYVAQVKSQWNKKASMRRMAPTPEREKELNWLMSNSTSAGLVGEFGIHQLDLTNWYLNGLPKSITGFGSIINWNDGRETADTVQCILEYPNNVRAVWTSTLASSFSGAYTLFQGSNSSLMMREKRSWMVKEADSALLGWEVYAAKAPCFEETGVCMIAEATKILKAGEEPSKIGPELKTDPVQSALEDFVCNIKKAPKDEKDTDPPKIAGPVEGYQATVTVIKANEAVVSGSKVACDSALFELK